MTARVVVLGANGWIGRHVVEAAGGAGAHVVAMHRTAGGGTGTAHECVLVSRSPATDELSRAFVGANAVVNAAGTAHVAEGVGMEDFANARLPERVVLAARFAGVPRVVHLSSIKAVSEGGRVPITVSTEPRPTSDYGRSKLLGERRAERANDGVQLTTVRLPLVYGPGARGNVARLESWLRRRMPIPLPAPYPQRSVAHVHNVAELLVHLTLTPKSPPPTVHWADLPHPRTDEFVRHLAAMMGVRAVVIPIPTKLARSSLRRIGRADDVERLTRPLIVEPGASAGSLDWNPPRATVNPGQL